MFVIVGLAIVFGSILVGYTMHGGKVAVLMQISEFIIIGGAGLGSMLAANSPSMVANLLKSVLGLLKGNPYTKERYMELLQMLHDAFTRVRREGLLALDADVENPQGSQLFSSYPFFHGHHHALSFMADTLKVMLNGGVAAYDLMEMMEIDLEAMQEETLKPSQILTTVGDAMPGFGIVAAVLGVVVTMGAIGGAPELVGHKVAAALVGTFIGILLAYGFFLPLASALAAQAKSEEQYLACIKCALLSTARGDPPATAVEFARRNIDPSVRPSFTEVEESARNNGMRAAA